MSVGSLGVPGREDGQLSWGGRHPETGARQAVASQCVHGELLEDAVPTGSHFDGSRTDYSPFQVSPMGTEAHRRGKGWPRCRAL